MGAIASVIFKMYVFLREAAHLAAGAAWEPSGAGTNTCGSTRKNVRRNKPHSDELFEAARRSELRPGSGRLEWVATQRVMGVYQN